MDQKQETRSSLQPSQEHYRFFTKRRLWHNAISMFGLFVAAVALLLIITFAVFGLISPYHNPYVDIIGFMILPAVFVFGLLIVPVGMALQYRAIHRSGAVSRLMGGLIFDLTNPKHRLLAALFLATTFFIVLPVVGVTGYHGYHYTESTEFCANVCHTVMEPQGVTHAMSPHARVACAECHIGSGAGWFVKSKLSGLGQVIAVMRDSYQRPIPPAITELRPARDTCEQCHWPAKFFGSQLREIDRFSSDEANTRHKVRMLLKTGGADEATGRVEGIHMHMALSGPIDYVATDHHLQNIPWVRYTLGDGSVRIYRSDGLAASAPPPAGVERRVDCMDCHNRGAHHFRAPQDAVDLFLSAGQVDLDIPYIKREMVRAISAKHGDRPAGELGVARMLVDYYRQEYPQVWAAKQKQIEVAAEMAEKIHRQNHFPAMNVDWRSYPDNIGHMHSSGCFRCHDGQHVDEAGRSLPSDCDICHTFLYPVEGLPNAFEEGRFRHSISLFLHENLRCDQCHAGDVLPSCRDCHATGDWLDQRGNDWFEWSKQYQPPRNPP